MYTSWFKKILLLKKLSSANARLPQAFNKTRYACNGKKNGSSITKSMLILLAAQQGNESKRQGVEASWLTKEMAD